MNIVTLPRRHQPDGWVPILRARETPFLPFPHAPHDRKLEPPKHHAHEHQHLLPRQEASRAVCDPASVRAVTLTLPQALVLHEPFRLEGCGRRAEDVGVEVELAVGDQEFGVCAEGFGADGGVGEDRAGGGGGVVEAEDFEVDGFEAGSVVQDVSVVHALR